MTFAYQNGAAVLCGPLSEKVTYHVSNEKISACFDGTGAVVYYANANGAVHINSGYAYFYVNGHPVDPRTEKTVTIIGRKQQIHLPTPAGGVTVTEFLTPSENGAFVFAELSDGNDANAEFGIWIQNIETVRIGSSGNVTFVPENNMIIATLTKDSPKASFFITYDHETSLTNTADGFAAALRECEEEISTVRTPAGLSEAEKACFFSSYFCALENFKVEGDYRAFMAGYRYLTPMRSYYRDAYFTVLAMYNGQESKVRDEIITLARGISEDGNCPSAVKSDYTAWWGNHFDSPSFFAMMLGDYVKNTGDLSILTEDVKGESVLTKARNAIAKLATFADETGLLYKKGKYNRRDWADAVNRPGYVTYDEVLFARANACLSYLCGISGDTDAEKEYRSAFKQIRDAINRELWDEELGYYINYRCEEKTEKNLSVDTVFAVLFGIADETRTERMMKAMETHLEVAKNSLMGGEDFGVMCVWPCYETLGSACGRSAQPFNYHNGANWPYLTAMYALAKRKCGMEWRAVLTEWFEYNIARNNYTPIEYFSPYCDDGSLLQAWSAATAFVLDESLSDGFFD